MKYEIIFGDEKLFDGAQKDCEMVGNGHHKVENGKLMVWNFSEKYWAESHTNKITIAAMRRIIKTPVQHSDDIAVDLFATKMKEKLEKSRDKGRSGWESCPIEHLISGLKKHIEKGDPVDVANFAMMISQRDESIKTPVWTVAEEKE